MAELEALEIDIPELDQSAMSAARKRQSILTKPPGSLGRLEELSVQLAGMRGHALPAIKRKAVVVMAGDHGVTQEGVSAYPSEVTGQMVHNFLEGGAAINVLAKQAGAEVFVVDLGVASDLGDEPGVIDCRIAPGTANICRGPAMSRAQAVGSIGAGRTLGRGLSEDGFDLIGTGEMGIGNTTIASALTAALLAVDVPLVVGRGTGVDDVGLARKIGAVETALAINQPDPSNPIEVLAKVGGFEIGGLAGLILEAAANRIPVVLDGFITAAAALIAARIAPGARSYMIASHQSVEIGHHLILEELGFSPILDLALRLGEGTGAALAIPIIESALQTLSGMATFEGAGVSNRK